MASTYKLVKDFKKKYPNTMGEAFKAFGNAVNVEVVKRVAEKLLEIRK